jgi:hypothetical protein
VGRLDRPSFGPIPGRHEFRPPRPPWVWDKLVDAVRQHPHTEMIVASYTRGGKEKTLRDAGRAEFALRMGLRRHYPAEDWSVRARYVPDTWYHRVVILCYNGLRSPEAYAKILDELEHEKKKQRERDRRLAWERRQARQAAAEQAIRDREATAH